MHLSFEDSKEYFLKKVNFTAMKKERLKGEIKTIILDLKNVKLEVYTIF